MYPDFVQRIPVEGSAANAGNTFSDGYTIQLTVIESLFANGSYAVRNDDACQRCIAESTIANAFNRIADGDAVQVKETKGTVTNTGYTIFNHNRFNFTITPGRLKMPVIMHCTGAGDGQLAAFCIKSPSDILTALAANVAAISTLMVFVPVLMCTSFIDSTEMDRGIQQRIVIIQDRYLRPSCLCSAIVHIGQFFIARESATANASHTSRDRDALQIATRCKCKPIYGGYIFRNRNTFQLDAANESTIANAGHAFRNCHIGQVHAATKRKICKAGYRIRNHVASVQFSRRCNQLGFILIKQDTGFITAVFSIFLIHSDSGQIDANSKRSASNEVNSTGNFNVLQTMATCKGILSNTCQVGRQRNRC